MSEKILNSSNFDEEIKSTDTLVLVDFFATWCGPCNMLAPIIEEISNEYSNKIKVCKVNVDEERDLALIYDVESITTIIFFKNGEPIKTSIGFHSKSELIDIIEELAQ